MRRLGMRRLGQVRPARRRPRPGVAVGSLVAALLLLVAGAPAALAQPEPLRPTPAPDAAGGAPTYTASLDWTPWVLAMVGLVLMVAVAAAASSALQRRDRAHV